MDIMNLNDLMLFIKWSVDWRGSTGDFKPGYSWEAGPGDGCCGRGGHTGCGFMSFHVRFCQKA